MYIEILYKYDRCEILKEILVVNIITNKSQNMPFGYCIILQNCNHNNCLNLMVIIICHFYYMVFKI